MPRKKKEEFVISESSIQNQVDINNLNIMNGYVILRLQEGHKGEVVSFGSINPLRLSVGESVYFDQSKCTKIYDNLYALKFDDIIARTIIQNSIPEKSILLEENMNQDFISNASPSVALPETNSQPVVPAVDPPQYNVTRSFQNKKNQKISTGVKHVDKPIRK